MAIEVQVSVDEDHRDGLWQALRLLGLAAVVVAAIAVLLASSLPSGGAPSRTTLRSLPSASYLPPLARNTLLLVTHPSLKRQLLNYDPCAESRNAALERKNETLYAQAIADATGAVLPGRAKLQATKYPAC